jgi:dUTP pyrophosphatase
VSVRPVVEIKVLDPRLREWGLPRYQTPGSAAFDVMACVEGPLSVEAGGPSVLVPLGFAMSMPSDDMAAVLVPRSGLGHKKGLVLGNLVGLFDADFQQQCMASVWNRNPRGDFPLKIEPGDRIAQLAFVPILRTDFLEVEGEFSRATARIGGFGSTGGSSA